MAEAKPDLCELIGIAVNASALDMAETHERPIERVAAVGAAAAEIALGADLAGLTLAAAQPDVYRASAPMADLLLDPGTEHERDVIAADLAPTLWHIAYGCQHGLIPQAIDLFSRWLCHRRLFAELAGREHQALRHRFCARVLHEWLSEGCIACGGSGKLERTRTGSWIRPRGSMQRNATFRPCDGCHGSGKAMASHGERARWLEITHQRYEDERWMQRFNAARTWLVTLIAGRLKRPLTKQLERRIKRS